MTFHAPSFRSAEAPAVSVKGLTRVFGPNTVLDQLNLEIAPGSFVALLGRSGSGKSTLLRTLAGLDPASPETVVVPHERAVVFQEPRLIPWKRVRRNITLGLREGEPDRSAEAVLAEVGLSHRIDAWPLTLSGGEAQRTALARALVRNPKLLLLDEPFAALDALTRLRMQRLVAALWEKRRPAVLLVTHDVDEALLLADRVLILADGRILSDTPIALPRPRRPNNPVFGRLRLDLLGQLGVDELGNDATASPSEATIQPITEPAKAR